MGYEDLIAVLHKQIDSEKETILSEARREAERILIQAKKEAERIREARIKKKDTSLAEIEEITEVKQGERKNLSESLVASKEVLSLRQKILKKITVKVKEGMTKIRKEEDYPLILKRLVREALSGLIPLPLTESGMTDTNLTGGGEVFLSIASDDLSLMGKILSELKLKCEVKPISNCSGGVIARSRDGKITVYNTLESRFEKAEQIIITEVGKVLYRPVGS